MTHVPSYLRYLETAKQAEVAASLREQGFIVEPDLQVEDATFDLVARKGTQQLAYEFKAGRSARTSPKNLLHLQEAAARQGWDFRIVVVSPPPRVHVEVEELHDHLLHSLRDHMPDALDQLSTHTLIRDVVDIEVSDIRLRKTETLVQGTAAVEVQLSYGSGSDQDKDQGSTLYDSFPIHFKVTLGPNQEVIRVDELYADTSSFYEE